MQSFNLKQHLEFNAKKEFSPSLGEYYQELATINFNEVFEGYKITFTKVECPLESLVYFEARGNHSPSLPTTYKTLEEMCDFYNDWKNELLNKKK